MNNVVILLVNMLKWQRKNQKLKKKNYNYWNKISMKN